MEHPDQGVKSPPIYVSDEPGLIAKLRVPLTGKRALMLSALVIEHPQHALTIESPFLVMRQVSE